MKILLSALTALLVSVALMQGAGAKTKIVVTEKKAATTTGKHRPPLDETATGGIQPLAGQTPKTADLGQAYPEALDLPF
ncbi:MULTISPECIES: hypothetical protein [unclassified Mesorhizobium]|uniref:hypothetical protein n=1 Tax=unclassified Mesorhizobium TaxID=325217 RepID=UPI000FD85EAE|nr:MULTISPECIES: hypothetical protein [unclassified Mesorhizobium]TGQ12344.1 hypothetical protein EN862_015765 [Mesorhizobium sp. M2E.F.Ca.ET.219.01.1.1]TGT68165.1 hypothetical protein EN809_027035 [Mesorhizobium sp. M2E.F.Ca.ET.166.01.1.1]TGW01169.1 hypothetical protein EN797_012345 [Mesorhizobium sp. M2E.F.Ca.ET.154.01.1.1]